MDFAVYDDASVCFVELLSPVARDWADLHVTNDETIGDENGFYCERQYVEDLVRGMIRDGLDGTVDGKPVALAPDEETVIIVPEAVASPAEVSL